MLLLGAEASTGEVQSIAGIQFVPHGHQPLHASKASPQQQQQQLPIVLSAPDHTLYISHIRGAVKSAASITDRRSSAASASAQGTVSIHHAQLMGGRASQLLVEDAPEVSTEQLTVRDLSDLRGDVVVGGSVNVRGSVIGRGPYVDSSDARLKTNIRPAFVPTPPSRPEQLRQETAVSSISSSSSSSSSEGRRPAVASVLERVRQLSAVCVCIY